MSGLAAAPPASAPAGISPLRPLALLCLLFLTASAALAAAPDFPPLSGRVVDQAGLLSPATEQRLTELLARHEAETSNQVVVVTLASLQGYPVEDFGYRLGRQWGIGQGERDNGALLIVAPEEREVRIEVGYGLEGTLTDALSRLIIERVIVPHFRDGDYEQGIVQGTEAIVEALQGTYEAPPSPQEAARGGGGEGALPALALMFVFAFISLLLWRDARSDRSGGRRGAGDATRRYYPYHRRHARRRGYPIVFPGGFGGRGGSSSGGGGFSGGGGSFGGGGASGSW